MIAIFNWSIIPIGGGLFVRGLDGNGADVSYGDVVEVVIGFDEDGAAQISAITRSRERYLLAGEKLG